MIKIEKHHLPSKVSSFKNCHLVFLVEVRINRTKMLSCFSSINSYFDKWHVQKQGLKTTHSSIVEENQNNCQRKNCRTSHLLLELLQKIIIFSKNTFKTSNTFIIHAWKDDTENKLPLLSFWKKMMKNVFVVVV